MGHNFFMKNKVFAVIPAFNEEERIEKVISETNGYVNSVIGSIFASVSFVAQYFLYPYPRIAGAGVIIIALVIPFLYLLLRRDAIIKKLVTSLDFLVIASIIYYCFYWFYSYLVHQLVLLGIQLK